MSGYDFLKSQVLSCWRKVESVCDVVISSGGVFQTRGPATVNARSPTVEQYILAYSPILFCVSAGLKKNIIAFLNNF